MTKNKRCVIKGDSKISKLDDTLKLVNKILKKIFENNPDYTGIIKINFYMGGLTNIKKEESLNIKKI